MYAGNKDKALTLLDRAYQQRCFGITWLAVDPTYDSLRSDRRFQILDESVHALIEVASTLTGKLS